MQMSFVCQASIVVVRAQSASMHSHSSTRVVASRVLVLGVVGCFFSLIAVRLILQVSQVKCSTRVVLTRSTI
jgi:multisubunit Na+/H+ antiporter MnhG subunit